MSKLKEMDLDLAPNPWISISSNGGIWKPHACLFSISLLTHISPTLSSYHNSQALLLYLFLAATSGLSHLILIFHLNLSVSLFLLNLNSQRLWFFLWVSFNFSVNLFGFHLIYLWVLFVHFVS